MPNACRPVTWDGAEQRRVALFRFFPVCCSPPLTVGNVPISVARSPNLRFLTFASVSFSPWRLKLRGSARAKNQWVGKHNVFPPRTTRTTPTSTRGSLYSEHLAQRSKRSSRRFVNQAGPHTKAAILLLRGSSVVPSKPPALSLGRFLLVRARSGTNVTHSFLCDTSVAGVLERQIARWCRRVAAPASRGASKGFSARESDLPKLRRHWQLQAAERRADA